MENLINNWINKNDENEILDLSNLNIKILPKLPQNLKKLNCSNNQIENLSVSYLKHLIYLDCSNNQIENLSVSYLKHLIYLDCSNNQISMLTWNTFNPSLEFLNCSNNKITLLDVQSLHNLQTLICDNNLRIRYLILIHLQKLNFISIKNTGLKLHSIDYNLQIKNLIQDLFPLKYIDIETYNKFYIENIDKCFLNKTYRINYTNLNKWAIETLEYKLNFDIIYFIYAFIKTLTHISFKVFYDNVCKLGYKLVELINTFTNKNIVFLTLTIEKSNNWVLLLIWKIIYPSLINNNYYIINDYNYICKISNPIIIYLDDCSYSGNQITKTVEIINELPFYKFLNNNFYIFTVYITDYALTKFNVNNLNIFYIEKLNNFKDNLNEDEKLCYNRILQNEYLQNLWLLTQSDGICNVYFDHKLASGVSIFQSLLAFGLTPQNNSYPLISGCENVYTPNKIQHIYDEYLDDLIMDLNQSLNQKVCPVSFYKTINYTYNNETINNFDELYKTI
jgi:hypothetical protein